MEENNNCDIIDFKEDEIAEEPLEKKQFKKDVFDWVEILVHAILAVVLCFSFLFRIATIDGESMTNTLQNGEKVIITNLAYEPKAGDIVVISRNRENSVYTANVGNKPIIKRIIATEGQTVDIDFEKGVVYVDGVALEEGYTRTPTNLKYDIDFPVRVDEGCVFVLGDNRNNSLDSRSSQIGDYGMIDTRYILGHAVCRIFPFDKIGKIDE
ncbi:MAG: signal peptidase I [Acutalibacteraceae bacterium]|nr:signal peptidase I [Acutalibacteraceae bacterium]